MASITSTMMMSSSARPPLKTSKPVFPVAFCALNNNKHHLSIAIPTPSTSVSALAGTFFSALSITDAALAGQQIADIAEGDNRGLALVIPIVPAILWVLYNILQPALNQINRMRSDKALLVGISIGGAATGLMHAAAPPTHASAAGEQELMAVADAAAASTSGDSRGLLLLFVIAPAIAWVLYNILQPALNQINRMRSG